MEKFNGKFNGKFNNSVKNVDVDGKATSLFDTTEDKNSNEAISLIKQYIN